MKYAVFIEPEGSLLERVVSCKERVAARLGNQPYNAHPPHCTLWVGALASLEYESLEQACRRVTPFDLATDGMVVFWNDAATDGGHTVAFRVVAPAALWSLQMDISQALSRFLPAVVEPPAWCSQPVLLESIRQYGYPFVGNHWIPHFSIASLHLPRGHELLRDLSQIDEKHTCRIEEFSLWQIEENRHEKLKTFRLGEAA